MKEFFLNNLTVTAQIAGIIATVLNILCFQFKKHRLIMLLMTVSSVFWILHYLLLGLYPGAIINLMNMFRNYIYGLREKKGLKSPVIPAVFVVIASVSVIYKWAGWWDLLPLTASITASIANWQTKTAKLKILSVPRYTFWAIYDIHGGAWAGLANDLFCIASIAVSLISSKLSEKKVQKTAITETEENRTPVREADERM